MKRLIPYPTLVGESSLGVCEVRLDGVPLSLGMLSTSRRVVALHQVERELWEEARISVRMQPPRREITEGAWTDVVCAAVLTERLTNARSVALLRREADGSWIGTVPLHRDDHVGQVELTGHVVATVGGVSGRTIGTADRPWTIDLQARTPERPNVMKIVTVDFADDALPHLNPYKNDPWMVEAAGDEPVIYLNAGFEGLLPLLTGGDRAIRESLAAQIAADAWSALFNAAIYAANVEEGQPQWPSGWRAFVLKRMLPDVFPDRSPDDALVEIVVRRSTGEGGGDLQTRLVHAAGRQALLSRRLLGFIRAVDRKESS